MTREEVIPAEPRTSAGDRVGRGSCAGRSGGVVAVVVVAVSWAAETATKCRATVVHEISGELGDVGNRLIGLGLGELAVVDSRVDPSRRLGDVRAIPSWRSLPC